MRTAHGLLGSVVVLAALIVGVAVVWLVSPPTCVVTWETASEVDTAGFLLYRGESASGPFFLLDETPIPAVGDPLTGTTYRHEDREVTWGRRYFYQLEEIETSGGRIRHPGVVEGQAGLGWPWALAIGASLAALAALLWRTMTAPRRQESDVAGDHE